MTDRPGRTPSPDEDDFGPIPLRVWLLNGPRSPWRWPIWLLDELLDRIPTYDNGRWYRKGGWGCRMRLHRWWVDKSEWEVQS